MNPTANGKLLLRVTGLTGLLMFEGQPVRSRTRHAEKSE
jgi:hypothetical protein